MYANFSGDTGKIFMIGPKEFPTRTILAYGSKKKIQPTTTNTLWTSRERDVYPESTSNIFAVPPLTVTKVPNVVMKRTNKILSRGIEWNRDRDGQKKQLMHEKVDGFQDSNRGGKIHVLD
jgi:predicted transposase YdaD